MIQVGLKPTKLGSNASAIVQLRDKSYINYEDSIISKAESSLCDGPIYFTYFPSYCFDLDDSCDTFAVDVKIKGSGGNESVVLMYRFHYKVVNIPFRWKYSGDFPVDKAGETTLYLAKIAEGNRVVSKTISRGEAETGQGSVGGNEPSSSSSSKFLRLLKLPKDANADEVKAGVENGVLTVTVPKKEVGKAEVKVIDISG